MVGDSPRPWWDRSVRTSMACWPRGADARVVRLEGRRFEIELDEEVVGECGVSYFGGRDASASVRR